MSQDQYSKLLNIAARLVTSAQITEDMHDWINSSMMPMKQRKRIFKIASEHNSKLRAIGFELRDAIKMRAGQQ